MKKFAALAALVCIWIFKAFVISTLWGWFAVPTFNVVPLSVVTVLGLQTLGGLALRKYEKQPERDFDYYFVIALLPAVSLGLGYIFKAFM